MRPIPKAFLLAIALSLAFEAFQAVEDIYFYHPGPLERRVATLTGIGSTPLRMRVKSRVAWSGSAPAQIAIFGDSTSYVGLMPDVIEQKTGSSVYNYGTLMREGKISSRLLLANLVRRHETRPEVIVLCWAPFSLAITSPPSDRLRFTYSHGNVRLLIEEFGFWGWIQSQIPTLRHQALLKSLVLDRVWPDRADFAAIDRAVELAERNKGHLPHRHDRVIEEAARYKAYVAHFLDRAPVQEFVDRQIRAILDIAREHDIRVVAFMAPIIPESHAFYSSQPRWPAISAYLPSLRERDPDMVVLDVQDEFMSNEYFSDPIHLNGVGARKLSGIVARTIAGLDTEAAVDR